MELCEKISEPRLYSLPELDDPFFAVEYHREHPVVEAAREYLRKHNKKQKVLTDKESNKENSVTTHEHSYRSELLKIWELERFFDLQNNPPSPTMTNDSSVENSKDRHPDLMEIKDPWYHEPEQPDLIDFDTQDHISYRESKLPDLLNFNSTPSFFNQHNKTSNYESEIPDLIGFSSAEPK